MRSKHIVFERLADYCDGRASEETAAEVRAHLAEGCRRCEAEVERLQRLLSVAHEGELTSAPEEALQSARNIFRERYWKPERTSWIARLVFDSRATPALAGARGEGPANLQLLYSTEDHDIDLWQEKTESGAWYLIGQIAPKGEPPVVPQTAMLQSRSGETFMAMPEADEFHLSDIPAGVYEMRLGLGKGEIVLPEVVVGP